MVKACLLRSMMRMWNRPRTRGLHGLANGAGRRWRWAFLFASLPLAGKLFPGGWGFDGAPGIACLCLVAAAYLYFAGRERRPPIPDSAAILDEAIRLAALGETGPDATKEKLQAEIKSRLGFVAHIESR